MVVPSKPPNPHNSKLKGKSPIVRLWSLEVEIAILRLHDSIRKSLSIAADTANLLEKMRSIRNKNIGASKRGDKLKLATGQDQTIYDLSDKIWVKEEEEEAAVGLKAYGSSSAAAVSKGKSSKRDFPFIRDALGGGSRMTLEMLETADVNKAVALEKSFKKLKSVKINLIRKLYKLL